MMEPGLLRILDANLNRAREALRVIEEYARFILDDADATAAIKRTRHDLAASVASTPHAALLDARDSHGDVGRDAKLDTELHRTDVESVVRAEFARLSEAARAVAEYGKLIAPAIVAAAETLRHRGYQLEQTIILRGSLRAKLRSLRLYVIITESLCRTDWLQTAAAALRGGAGCLQLREKTLPDRELLRRAMMLRDLTRSHDALLCINDRPDIARLVGADMVHVGQDDLSVAEVRRIAGGRTLVGKSTHTPAQIAAALLEEPDYIAVGPMFATTTKPQDTIAGVETLRYAAERTSLPRIAIGGITAATAPSIFAAGATCICVCSAVIAADDVEAATRAFCDNDATPKRG
ncbi:MAG: thiamine phosphate synthase [Phycisphaerae bacterium]